MQSKITKALFILLFFSAKTSLAAEMENDVEMRDSEDTSLIKAIKQRKSLKYFKSLVESGGNIHETDSEGHTALMYAGGFQGQSRLDITNFLLTRGARTNDKCFHDFKALGCTTDPKIKKALRESGAQEELNSQFSHLNLD